MGRPARPFQNAMTPMPIPANSTAMAPTRIAVTPLAGSRPTRTIAWDSAELALKTYDRLGLDVGRAIPGADRAGPVVVGAVRPIEVDLLAVLVEERQFDVRDVALSRS